jgi:GCN5-like protein 1 (GCN5L1)
MELTKEDLKEHTAAINKRFDGLEQRIEKQTKELQAYADDQTEKLAVMVANGFEEIKGLLDVRERIKALENDMRQIKQALHIG